MSPRIPTSHSCARCGATFEARDPQAKFCSRRCAGNEAQSVEDIWRFVAVAGPDECWKWTGSLNKYGYGQVSIGRNKSRAHRVAYTAAHGEIPDGACVLHRCDNRACCNPSHLFLGSRADNQRDMGEKGRSTLGERHPKHKLTESDVREIRARRGEPLREIASAFGISRSTVSLIHLNRIWRHV